MTTNRPDYPNAACRGTDDCTCGAPGCASDALSVDIARDDVRGIRDLARQDQAGEVDDSYARTGDAEDTIRRWYDAGRSAGDRDLVDLIDRVGVRDAARIYEAARS